MSNYMYVCPCCRKTWTVNSTGPKPKKAELDRMCCKLCETARWDIEKEHRFDGAGWVKTEGLLTR